MTLSEPLPIAIRWVDHQKLTDAELSGLQALFDREYLAEFGDWDPELPYGYAPHSMHVIAHRDGKIVGHVGWAPRQITVGASPVMVAGVGGVLVAPTARGLRLGNQLMLSAEASMREDPDLEFGFLGCDESVVAFYASCGWQRVAARERSTNRDGVVVETPAGPPLMFLALQEDAAPWPSGTIDLQGRAW